MTNGIGNLPTATTVRASGDNDPVIPKIPGPRQPSGLAPRDDRSDADRAAFTAASYVRRPASITAAAASTMHLRTTGDRNPTNYDFDATNQLVAKAGTR